MALKPAKQLEIAKSACDWEPKNRKLRIDYRRLCIQLSRPELAGFEYGDQVRVMVIDDEPWEAEWRGRVVEIKTSAEHGTFLRVSPINNQVQLRAGAEMEWLIPAVWVSAAHVELVEAATP